MKKLVILGTALLALNAVASEIQLKAGYDLSRKYKNGNGDIEDFKFKKGPTLGLEYIFDNQGEFEWGLGAEYKFSSNSGSLKDKDKIDTFGLRLGYRLGNLVNDRQPKIVERVVRETVTVTPPAPVKQPIVTGKTVALPFSCAADERKCIIRGFKVDGRVPSETEAQDLRTIAGIINQFADGGSIDFIGHTDSTGSDAYNQKLSVARAQNVARLLREYGLKNSVSYGAITGRGESQPADTNATVEGRYNNRRVELFFNNVDFSNVTFTN